jgi:hypothetical protein
LLAVNGRFGEGALRRRADDDLPAAKSLVRAEVSAAGALVRFVRVADVGAN